MRVGFISDAWATTEGARTMIRPAIALLDPRPRAVYAAPGSAPPFLYAGVAELTTAQADTLRARAQVAGVRLVLFPNLTGRQDAEVVPTEDRPTVSLFAEEAGISADPATEGRGVILDRLQRRLNGSRDVGTCLQLLTEREQGPRAPRRDGTMLRHLAARRERGAS